ncbi:MAG: hypothetical protein QW782_05615 [Candidatus Bathyarchaeia archaeon]
MRVRAFRSLQRGKREVKARAGAIPWVTETLPALIYLASNEKPQVA